jgi:hypothetical protein
VGGLDGRGQSVRLQSVWSPSPRPTPNSPVWGQLNMPVRSARAAASISSSSVDSSTMPLVALSARMALGGVRCESEVGVRVRVEVKS